jgi:hypothetical protein
MGRTDGIHRRRPRASECHEDDRDRASRGPAKHNLNLLEASLALTLPSASQDHRCDGARRGPDAVRHVTTCAGCAVLGTGLVLKGGLGPLICRGNHHEHARVFARPELSPRVHYPAASVPGFDSLGPIVPAAGISWAPRAPWPPSDGATSPRGSWEQSFRLGPWR